MANLILLRIARGLPAILCTVAIACSGGSDGPTDPGPIPPDEVPPTAPLPAPPEVPPGDAPGPPQPVITGTYMLLRVNDAEPGQTVTLSNPDGSVMGRYRFEGRTLLALTEDQHWLLQLHFAHEDHTHDITDEGRFERHGDDSADLSFTSGVFGDVFEGRARDAVAKITYDVDGNGQPETVLTFGRVLGPGT